MGSTGSSGSPSDYRLKENLLPYLANDSQVIVKSLKSYQYNFIGKQERVSGFIAHEVQEAGLRQAVIGEKDASDTDGNPIYQQFKAWELVPTLWTSLRDCLLRIEKLESQVDSLINKQ
jgi:hypothetical protein